MAVIMGATYQDNLSLQGEQKYLSLFNRCSCCLKVKNNDKYYNKIQMEPRAYYPA